jgi:hypothetical protein
MSKQPQMKQIIENNNNGLYEKDEYEWFTLKDIREKRNKFRPFYVEILDNIEHTFNK